MSLAALFRAFLAGAGLLPWGLAAAGARCSNLVRPAFHPLCHQWPERTLHLHGCDMVVCSRCAGIYLGLALAALLPAPPWMARHGRTVVLVAGGVMALDVLLLAFGFQQVHHGVRIGTGLAVGWAGSAWLLASLRGPRGE